MGSAIYNDRRSSVAKLLDIFNRSFVFAHVNLFILNPQSIHHALAGVTLDTGWEGINDY
jgi:hypothetical protein